MENTTTAIPVMSSGNTNRDPEINIMKLFTRLLVAISCMTAPSAALAQTPVLLRTFNNPTPDTGDQFGSWMAALGNGRVLIGATATTSVIAFDPAATVSAAQYGQARRKQIPSLTVHIRLNDVPLAAGQADHPCSTGNAVSNRPITSFC